MVWAAAPDVSAAQVGLVLPQHWPGVLSWLACAGLFVLVLVSTRALRSGALAGPPPEVLRRTRPGEARHAEPPGQATLALLPRSRSERRLFALVGVTAGSARSGSTAASSSPSSPRCSPRCPTSCSC